MAKGQGGRMLETGSLLMESCAAPPKAGVYLPPPTGEQASFFPQVETNEHRRRPVEGGLWFHDVGCLFVSVNLHELIHLNLFS